MVVDDVLDDPRPALMARIDELHVAAGPPYPHEPRYHSTPS